MDLLEPELQEVKSHLTWVLGTEFRSSARAVYALNHGALSPVPERLKAESGRPFFVDTVKNTAVLFLNKEGGGNATRMSGKPS